MRKQYVGAAVVGLIEGLLLLRLVALLFAARPDNSWIALLLALTVPVTAPFRLLDQWAGQPHFGARLELATLAALLLLACGAAVWHWWSVRAAAERQSR